MTELVVHPGGAAAAQRASQDWLSAARRAKALSWLSLVWMSLEGGSRSQRGSLPARSR